MLVSKASLVLPYTADQWEPWKGKARQLQPRYSERAEQICREEPDRAAPPSHIQKLRQPWLHWELILKKQKRNIQQTLFNTVSTWGSGTINKTRYLTRRHLEMKMKCWQETLKVLNMKPHALHRKAAQTWQSPSLPPGLTGTHHCNPDALLVTCHEHA